MTGNAAGNDIRYYEEKVEAARNFANKIWNASRFVIMNLDKEVMKNMKTAGNIHLPINGFCQEQIL